MIIFKVRLSGRVCVFLRTVSFFSSGAWGHGQTETPKGMKSRFIFFILYVFQLLRVGTLQHFPVKNIEKRSTRKSVFKDTPPERTPTCLAYGTYTLVITRNFLTVTKLTNMRC